jgi:hypothetical protein
MRPPLTVQNGQDPFRSHDGHAQGRLLGKPRHMRRDNHIVQIDPGIIGFDRFRREYIQAGAVYSMPPERPPGLCYLPYCA